MKSLKNSIKKLRASWMFRDSSATIDEHQSLDDTLNDNEQNDIEVKWQNYLRMIGHNNYIDYKGYQFPSDSINKRVLENLEDFECRDDDIYLIAYPSNGLHLLEDIVQILLQKHFDKLENDGHNGATGPEAPNSESNPDPLQRRPSATTASNQHQITNVQLESSNLYGHIRWLNSLRSPRLISTYLPYDLLPKQLQNLSSASSFSTASIASLASSLKSKIKIIYIGRNCKDHLIAYYYYHRLKKNFINGTSDTNGRITLNDFVDLYLAGKLLYGDYFDHMISYWQLSRLNRDNVLFICYEELKIITKTIIKLIVKFLQLNLEDNEIDEIIAEKQFNGVQCVPNGHNEPNATGDNDKNRKEFERKQMKKVQKFHNIFNDWDNYLNNDQCRRLDAMIEQKFSKQNLSLVDNYEMAVVNIEKYGRILVDCVDHRKSMTSTGHNDLAITDAKIAKLFDNDLRKFSKKSVLSLHRTSTNRRGRNKKLILTKDEAKFLRRKDKIIIIENDRSNTLATDNESKVNFWRKLFCCLYCYHWLFNRRQYDKI